MAGGGAAAVRWAALALVLAVAAVSSGAAAECGAPCLLRAEKLQTALRSSLSLAPTASHAAVASAAVDSSNGGIININPTMFDDLINKSPRNFSMILMLTALSDGRDCVPCKQGAREFKLVARSFYKEYPNVENVLFGLVDFDRDGGEIFRKLQCQGAPTLFAFKGSGKPGRALGQMDNVDEIANYLHKALGYKVKVVRPVDYGRVLAFFSTLAVIGATCYFFWPAVYAVISYVPLWAYAAIAFALFNMGGLMWLQIRGAPFIGGNKNGPEYVHGSNGYQYGAECFIIAGVQGAITVGLVLLAEVASRQSGKVKTTMTIFCVALVFVVFSILYRLFRDKYGGYPYKLLF